MRQRDAERIARHFVAERYPECKDWHFDIALEHDGERRKSWSFGLTPDEEAADYEKGKHATGYVHANGYVEGLY